MPIPLGLRGWKLKEQLWCLALGKMEKTFSFQQAVAFGCLVFCGCSLLCPAASQHVPGCVPSSPGGFSILTAGAEAQQQALGCADTPLPRIWKTFMLALQDHRWSRNPLPMAPCPNFCRWRAWRALTPLLPSLGKGIAMFCHLQFPQGPEDQACSIPILQEHLPQQSCPRQKPSAPSAHFSLEARDKEAKATRTLFPLSIHCHTPHL